MREGDSSERRALPERLSIDSGVLLAYLLGEKIGEFVRDEVLAPKQRSVYYNHIVAAEAFYILCRRRGRRFAHNAVEAFLAAGYGTLVSMNELDSEAGFYKCERAISLADCYVIGLGKLKDAAAIFAKKEQDLVAEMARRPFDVEILFLEDLL